jgi:hypothetical protein
MKKLPSELKSIAVDKINWRAELEETLRVTVWTRLELATVLGLYVQQREDKQSVSPHIYAWMRGKNKPRLYLLYALMYLRARYGQATPAAPPPPANPTE